MNKQHRDKMVELVEHVEDLNEVFEILEQYQEKNNLFEDPDETPYDLYDYFEEYGGEEAYEPAYVHPADNETTATLG